MSNLINYKHLHLNYFVEKYITFSYAFSNWYLIIRNLCVLKCESSIVILNFTFNFKYELQQAAKEWAFKAHENKYIHF